MARSQSQVLTDHDEIRRWAEERNAAPACVRGTGGKNDIGMLRLDFPGYSGQQSLEHIDWDEWFEKFDENGLALLVQDSTAGGERSNFNKLVSRGEGRGAKGGGRKTAGRKSNARSTRTSSVSSRRKTTRKAGSAKKKGRRTTARKAASTRSRSTAAKSKSRSTARKSSSRSTSRSSSRSRTNARGSASTRSGSNRSRRNTRTAASSSRRSSSSGSSRRGASQSARSGRAASHVLVDHDEIRRWAENRNAEPACVRGTGGGNDPGMIRLDFPGYSGADSLERIDWDEWFRAFDESNLALVVQDTTSGGEQSNFNKLVSRENAMSGSKRGSKSGSRVRASAGNSGTKKAARGSNRAQRTESARGRTTSQRKAA